MAHNKLLGASRARLAALGAAFLVIALTGPFGTLAAYASAPVAVSSPSCSWAGESDARDVNVGAPDTNAHYWYGPLDGAAGSRIAITGSFPRARYFSFTLYGNDQQAQTSIYDQQIVPDPGSSNPYVGPGRAGQPQRYTVHVLFENAPAHPAPHTLYAGPAQGTNSLGFMILRIYLPNGTESGGVELPQINVQDASGATNLAEGACSATPPSFGAPYWQAQAEASAPSDQATPANDTSTPPRWTRSFDNGFGNEQNSYLQVLVSHHWGQLVVAHFRAPTFPDTSRGQPVYGPSDLRYWSVCTYDSSGTAAFGCVPDQAFSQHDGWVTLVVSDPAHRPRDATSAAGVAWLPWSPNNEIQVMERNMLPAAGFSGASQRITTPTQNARAAQIMGSYYPTSAYCSTAAFERGGWQACLPGLARALAPTSTAPARGACPPAAGRLTGMWLGPVRLGSRRSALRRALPRHRTMANHRFDEVCLRPGPGIRVGFLSGRAALAMTANRHYRYAHVAPGMRLGAALRRLGAHAAGPIRRGRFSWYARRMSRATLLIKTAHGAVAEIGIGLRSPSGTTVLERRLLARLGA